MKKIVFYILLLCVGQLVSQECPSAVLVSPVNGSTDVPVNTTISWNSVPGVPGYIISIGTTPGGGEVVNEINVGNATSYTPPLGLPDNSTIYVTVTLFFFQGISPIPCATESFTTIDITTPPGCTFMRNPLDGATNVNIASSISWLYAPTATGYRITLGTAPGLGDIVNDLDVGNVLSFNPPGDLPTSTTVYVEIVPYNENGDNGPCPEESFTTGDLATLPGCTSLISPFDGEINVPLTPNISWTEVSEATGYLVTLGSTPFSSEVLDNVLFLTNSTFVINFEPNTTYFIRIIPFNDAGQALGCMQESFSTVLGCGPFFDPNTGELIDLNPVIDFPDRLSFCSDELPVTVTSTDTATGFRWYEIDRFGIEQLISDTDEVVIENPGQYRYEAFDTLEQSGASITCVSAQPFDVIVSGAATVTEINLSEQGTGTRIEVLVEGPGDYEYALNNIDGPYQDSNIFDTSSEFFYTVYIRDKNGCGITEEFIEQDITLDGFPKFFTPNGDGINDFWQFVPPETLTQNPLEVIYIFDRYGKLLVQIDPISPGWDGTFNGVPLPSTDYWFRARSLNNTEIQGHFALKK